MAITSLKRDFVGSPNIVRMEATNTLAEVEATGYLATQTTTIEDINSGTWTWLPSDMILCYASDGLQLFVLNADLDDFVVYSTAGNGAVTLPVVSGNFTVFDGTLGALEDLGYAPSDATKTSVIMADAAVIAGHIAVYTDTAGTISDDAATAINAGNIQAGLSGTAGNLISFPATAANGSLIISALNAGGAFNTTIRNSVMGQSSVISIPDPADAIGRFLIGATATPFVSGNFPVASGTGGLMVDSGFAAADILQSALDDGHIFVGNALGVATDVALSGDATIVNTGALTIANDAITTGKILNANVTLAKLAAGIAPAGVVKFMGQLTTVGGAAQEAFTVTGAVGATDLAFVQIVDDGTNNVTILEAVVTNDTLTITFSGNPANDTIFNYQLLRAAS